MLNRLFGNYLVEKEKLTLEQLNALLPVKKDAKAGVEVVAVVTKAMAPDAVERILAGIDSKNEYFGEAAVNEGCITDIKLDEILTQQSNNFMKFIKLLVDAGYISYDDINSMLDEFQEKNEFNNEQLDALIHDDLEQCIDIFAPLKLPELRELIKTLVQTLRRAIDEDMYLGKMYTESSVQMDKCASQMLVGDVRIKVYISSPGDGLLAIANHFTGDTYDTVTEDALDSVGEFINCVNGLYATNMSYDGVSVDMKFPEYTVDGPLASGEKLYIIPMHVNGYTLNAVLEVYQ